MIASVGMAVCKRAATPTALHVIAENSMTCIMSVTQPVRSAVMPQSNARRPTTTSTSVDSDIHIGRCAWTEGNRSPQGRAGERRPISSCFLYRRKQDFLNGQRPLFLPSRRMASCHARRWGWRRRHGGKLIFRLAEPPATLRRSRQSPPRLFVFMSTYYRSIY